MCITMPNLHRWVNQLPRYGRLSIFLKMAAVRHLGFLLYACLDHPQRVFGGLCHCATFHLNQCSIFDNMKVLIF